MEAVRLDVEFGEIRGIKYKIINGVFLWECEKYAAYFTPQSCISYRLQSEKSGNWKYYHCRHCERLDDMKFMKEVEALMSNVNNPAIKTTEKVSESKKGTCVICGKEFEPYKWGRTVVYKKCLDCMKKSMSGKKSYHKIIGHENSGEMEVIVDFSPCPEVLHKLRDMANTELRTLGMQILYILRQALQEEK